MNKGKVLIVESNEKELHEISQGLQIVSYNTHCLPDYSKLDKTLEENKFDVIIANINIPEKNGKNFLEQIKFYGVNIPIIVMSQISDTHNFLSYIKKNTFDFIRKPFKINELIDIVNHATRKKSLDDSYEEYHEILESLVMKRTDELVQANRTIQNNLIKTILAMVNALEASDLYTRGHSERVTAISLMLLKKLGLDNKENTQHMRLGAILHDIGKIGIITSVLNKPGKLSEIEYKSMREHPNIGYNIISPIDLNEEVLNIVRQHHEKFDGSGYPFQLKYDEISIFARIVSVADTYDAITSDRAYRKGKTKEIAFEEINKYSNTQFDKEVVKALNSIYYDITTELISKVKVI